MLSTYFTMSKEVMVTVIDICIVTYRNEETIVDVLASVESLVPEARILIWDNSPDGLTRTAVDRWSETGTRPQLTVHGGEGNLGFGQACNRLAGLADARWILFLNPDAKILAWDDALLSSDVKQMTGALVTLPDGELQETFGRDRGLSQEARIRLLRQKSPKISLEHSYRTDFVSGAAVLIDRAEFLSSGGFDTKRFFMYYEDIDFGKRWRERGGIIVVDPTWRVSHLGGHSAKKDHLSALIQSYRSAAAYHQRWSKHAWLFRWICATEAILKLLVSLPRGHVGQTNTRTQWRFVLHLLRNQDQME